MKKILVVMLAIALLFGSIAFADEAAQTEPVIWVVRGVNNVENKADNAKVWEEIQARCGIDIDFVVISTDDWAEKSALMIASGEKWDVMNIVNDSGNWMDYYLKGAIQPWNDYLDLMPAFQAKMTDDMYTACRDSEGNIYALPRTPAWPKGGAPAIRQDWLDELGMECPDTIAELEEYLQAVYENDMNGNGDPSDEIPIMPFVGNEDEVFRPLFLGFSGKRFYNEGVVLPWYMHENCYPMLEMLHKWYSNGWLLQDYLTSTVQAGFDLITANRVGGWFAPYNAGVGASSRADVKMDWVSLSNLTDGPEGGAPAWYTEPEYIPELILSADSKNVEWACKYLDWIFQDIDNYMLARYGIEGDNWEYTNDEKTEFRTLNSDDYTGFYQLNEWYDYANYPAQYVSEDNYSGSQQQKLRDKILTMNHVGAFDYFMSYNLEGTDAELLTGDSDTMIEEALTKVIMGDWGEEEWNDAVQNAWDREGKVYSEVWTEQYNAYMGI